MKKNIILFFKKNAFFFSLLILLSLLWFGIGQLIDPLHTVSTVSIIVLWSLTFILFIAGKIVGHFLSPLLKQLDRTPF